MKYILEVIGFNIESCITAQDAGAGRIELCASPPEGGTTPSYAFVKAARRILHIPLYVMIRPRGGDFLYTDDEFKMMQEDIRICKDLGADGVVLGMLKENGAIDIARTSALVEIAYPLGVTFHRAFDRVRDYRKALKDVISTGCERILTSGLHPDCMQGIEILKDLTALANHEIIIMPGSGVRPSNIVQIVEETGAIEIHSSASVPAKSAMQYQNAHLSESLDTVKVDGDTVKIMVDLLCGI